MENNEEYNNVLIIVSVIKVVNDTAKRNINLMKDFKKNIMKNKK